MRNPFDREARLNRQGGRHRPNYALIAGIVALVVLFFAPIVVGLRLQSVQRGYYNAIARHVLSHQPSFTDAMAQPDGRWPVKAPDGGHDPSYRYQEGAYQITGGPAMNTVEAMLSTSHGDPATFGDAAIEVTARQAGMSEYNGVGLILRDVESGPNGYFVAFWITPDGGWSLSRFAGNESAPGGWTGLVSSSDDSSRWSPVHKGLGAANTILVVMRGDEIICFVNGQFVTAARDSHIPASGRAGVFLDDSANTGIFSDFAVYPAA